MDPVQVRVQQGVLQGKRTTTPSGYEYYSFEGIPYAKPPIGKLRFREPQEPENWEGILDATKPGNKCAQSNPFAPNFVGSEDCLYLNVYTPCLSPKELEKLPVIFYVHGGRLVLGYGDYHRPDYFIEKGVIFVTINYRLTVLGFLALDIPEVPGNAGLKDSVLALKWVNRNIASFGGDVSNITAMGESAGAAVVTSFLVSKSAAGLFHKIIVESGTATSDLYMEDNKDKAKDYVALFGKELTNPYEIYEYLLTVPVEELIDAVCASELSKLEINAYFLPVVEKKFPDVVPFFEEYPYVSFKANRFAKVPCLCGINSHEGALFMPRDFEGNLIMQTDLTILIPKFLFIDRNSNMAKRIARDLQRFYFRGKAIDKDSLKEYVDLFSDAYFLRDLYMLFDHLSKYQDDVYCYRFSYSGNLNTRVMKELGLKGASHGDIIQYQFYKKNKAEQASQEDKNVTEFLSEVWTNFAKTGKPTWRDQKTGWLPYTYGERFLLNIDSELTLSVYPERERIEFWKKIVTARSKM